ncbi:hypothetical protein ILUMI_01151 [Ignelater luminosus]|uniref:Seminal fluid protein HACP044 n=1 Tax=Ignelater luminosus TaxID=2038154 RepID=A0A8K0GPH9_IGNLU|nr:hypothetical protein ILUMI_01151 [Ignelater luminosus]
MKYTLIFVLSLIAIASAQRPWYAGTRPIGYPDLGSRFKEDGDVNQAPSRIPNLNDYYNVPPKGIPIDAHGDIDLVNRLNSWPRQNRPFWILNAEQIEAHRNTNRNRYASYNNNNF